MREMQDGQHGNDVDGLVELEVKQALAKLKKLEPLDGWHLGWTTKVLPFLDAPGALDLLQRLRRARIPIHVFHCVQTISLCSRSAAWVEALTALDLCKLLHPTSVIAINAAMAACVNGSQWHRALTLLQDVLRMKHQDDMNIWLAAAVMKVFSVVGWLLSGVDGNRTGFYFHPAVDHPADCLPPGVPRDPTFYSPNLWPDKDELPELRPLAREASLELVEIGRRLASAVDWRCSQVHPHYRPGILQELVAPAEKCNHKCRLICYHERASHFHKLFCTSQGYERATMAIFLQPHAHEDKLTPPSQSCCGLPPAMFLLYQPKDARGVNFLNFCQREGF
eukprot:Skav219694  [mRNA]  locus=scaffold817:211565:222696:+ [translate_table: standard]